MSHQSRVISSFASRALSAVLMILFCLEVSSPDSARAKDLRPAKTAIQSNYSQFGKWDIGFQNHPPVHVHVLPDGKVLFWLQLQTTGIQTFARLWDPSSNTLTNVYYNPVDLFCSGHSFLPDGRLLVTGGTIPGGGIDDGTIKSTIYNYTTNTWTDGVDMNKGRWYPTNVTLGNGETLVVSGSYKYNGQPLKNSLPQVWLTTGGWRNLPNATTSQSFPLYPWMHLLSNGSVFYSGPTQSSLYMTTTGDGSLTTGPTSQVYRDEGSAVMYDVDKVLVVGGGNPPTETAQVIDLSGLGNPNLPPPAWTWAAPMTHKRRHLNTTILPNGKILVTGGTSGAGFNNTCPSKYVLPAEIWDPDNNTWTPPLASMTYPRLYHSAAVLLPDGRVLVTGTTEWGAEGVDEGGSGDIDCPPLSNQYFTEIFSPPYLFNPDGTDVARPFLKTAPTNVTYGQTFNLVVSGKVRHLISKVTLVRLSSTTHSFNQNQRFNNLSFNTSHLSGLSVTMPSNPNACPPGHYMLFVINSAGVPSEAKIIKLS